MEHQSAVLLRRLNPYCAQALEAAASLCQTRAHAEITPEHWLLKLLEQGEGDITVIARRYEWDIDNLWQSLLAHLDVQSRSVKSRPQLSEPLISLMQQAWLCAATDENSQIRGVHLLMALVGKPSLLKCDGLWPLLSAGHMYAHQTAEGLYRVKFDADRDSKQQGYESMLLRLAKPYGGDTYGIHFPLIQGTEVAVAFHEGDPDRPYIAHALHDSRHPDHVTDANNTRNVIRTPANNKLRMEDKRGEEHVKLSTEYGGKTQLNLGHNVDVGRALRGEGFELRTDQWGAIRAGKGIFISADRQELAGGLQLDMHEAVANLQAALQDAKGIRSAAEKAKAELADIERQKALLMESMTDLKKQALLFSAPAGIAQVTPASIQLSSGENVIVTSGADTDVSVAKKFRLGVKETISLFAQWMGIKIFASKGKVEIQAQGDAMDLLAKKTLSIASKDEQVIITAATELVLSCGGAYIRLKDGEIEVGAPGNVRVKSIGIQKMAPAILNARIELPDPCATAIDAAGGTQSPTVTLG